MNLDEFKTVEQLAAAIKTMDMVTAVPWTDYSATSTIVGWSSYTTKEIYYKKIGKLVFVRFFIRGVSDNTVTTFTLPYSLSSDETTLQAPIRIMDTGTYAVGLFTLAASSATVNCYPAIIGGTWTNSGDKRVYGHFWYET